jgi:VIT1/CCC1 family predicted Fe2+/Mn2+ transporter
MSASLEDRAFIPAPPGLSEQLRPLGMQASSSERHRAGRTGWLRAAVLGANDGILSTSSLMLGVAAAHATHVNVLVTGVAGLVAGAMSMAAGEYVSVHSQADTEKADLDLERTELANDTEGEHKELMANIRRSRPRSISGESGRHAVDGARCVWRACPRRTRHLRSL